MDGRFASVKLCDHCVMKYEKAITASSESITAGYGVLTDEVLLKTLGVVAGDDHAELLDALKVSVMLSTKCKSAKEFSEQCKAFMKKIEPLGTRIQAPYPKIDSTTMFDAVSGGMSTTRGFLHVYFQDKSKCDKFSNDTAIMPYHVLRYVGPPETSKKQRK